MGRGMTELTLTRGDTITVSWTLASRTRNARTGTYTNTPIDITDATCRIYFREGSATGTVAISATSEGVDPEITITGTEGLISLEVPAADTDSLLGVYYYDVELTYADGVVKTIDSGTLAVSADVTYT